MRKPKAEPKSIVIMLMGISEIGSFHPIRMAEGSKTRNEMTTPFMTPFILKFVCAIKKPDTTQREKADRFASHDNFWKIIGITSMTPASMPQRIPSFVFDIVSIIFPLFSTQSSILHLNNDKPSCLSIPFPHEERVVYSYIPITSVSFLPNFVSNLVLNRPTISSPKPRWLEDPSVCFHYQKE